MKSTKETQTLLERYDMVRQASLAMCHSLEPEQFRIQPSEDTSPTWWNLAHTSWFFARNVLHEFPNLKAAEDQLFDYVLNSYYSALGLRLERNRRGFMTRPTVQEVFDYRKSVDERMKTLINGCNEKQFKMMAPIIEVGLQHEQQHQELFYGEVKYLLYQTPKNLRIAYQKQKKTKEHQNSAPASFVRFEGGLHRFGNLDGIWGWDNEFPIHQYYLEDYALQNRLVSNREFMEFVEDGGYEKQLLWLDNGWNKMQQGQWKAPLYWEKCADGTWEVFTLSGMEKINLNEPVSHISFYEAEAFATWKGLRLPSEREWEHAARMHKISNKDGNFLDSGLLKPSIPAKKGLSQLLGELWQWTSSYYEPYPGYKPFEGSLVEYNEKFMDNQRVLRGGSCVSERDHIRISYRNFWPPETRFQFTGIRLAK